MLHHSVSIDKGREDNFGSCSLFVLDRAFCETKVVILSLLTLVRKSHPQMVKLRTYHNSDHFVDRKDEKQVKVWSYSPCALRVEDHQICVHANGDLTFATMETS